MEDKPVKTLDERIESQEGTVKYWHNRWHKQRNDYARKRWVEETKKLDNLKWRKANP